MTNIKLRFAGQSILFSGSATSGVEAVFLGSLNLPIFHELAFLPISPTGAELLFEVFSQRYERGSILVTTNLPFDEWTEVFGSERLNGALLDCLHTPRPHPGDERRQLPPPAPRESAGSRPLDNA